MKNFILLLCFLSLFGVNAQNIGDTITVQTLEFSDITKRRGWYVFPSDTNSYHKILMYYTLKCDAATTQDGFACGEWDYTTYTNLYQHENIGTSRYFLGHRTPDTIFYSNDIGYDVYQSYQKYPVYDAVTSENDYIIGSGTVSSNKVLQGEKKASKSQYLFTAAELTTSGLVAGEINRLELDLTALGTSLNNLTIKVKNSDLLELTSESIEDSLQTVYAINTTYSSVGSKVFDFTTPFLWDGSSNVVVEFSYLNEDLGVSSEVNSETTTFNSGVYTSEDDGYLNFSGDDYVEVPSSVFDDVSDEVTISFWCKGDTEKLPMQTYVFEGVDANGRRVLNAHLPWDNSRVYWDAGNGGTSSYDRVEEAANIESFAGGWNHWAFTKNATTGVMSVYLNGNLFKTGTGKTRTMAGISKFKIGGRMEREFKGDYEGGIDEFRVWNVSLSQSEIQNWMNKTIDNTHPNYANLKAAYDFNEASGLVAGDYSNNSENGMLMGVPSWTMKKGVDYHMNFQETSERPNVIFKRGVYTMHLDSNLVDDTVWRAKSSVVQRVSYIDINTTGLSANTIDTTYINLTGYSYTYSHNGQVIDSSFNANDGYYGNSYEEKKHQLQNYVTPYGVGINLGPDGFRWVYDVTDYAPLFLDTVEISAGNQQELIDLKFIMIKGTPPRDILGFETIWNGDYQHADIANDVVMPAVDRELDPQASHYTVRTRTTGHWFGGFQNCAEFCPKNHNLSINGTQQFEWLNWKKCAGNPIIAQGGTWIYDRAGWCPGTFAETFNHDITPYVTPGQTASIDYGMEVTSGGMEGNYRTTVQLISYGENNFTNDAAIDEILSPNNWEYRNRINPICNNPKVVIKNTGGNTLTRVSIFYSVCGDNESEYIWEGSLEYGETEIVELPIGDQSFWDHARYCNLFNVHVDLPNGVQDEYKYNNYAQSEFETPPTYPSNFYIWLKTNAAADQNVVTISDVDGNVVFSRDNMTNSTTYKDTLNLSPGCYKFQITDSGENGLSFFANNEGSGFVRLRKVGGSVIKTFNSNFGDELTQYFTVGYGVGIEDNNGDKKVEIFPNPGAGIYNLEIDGFGGNVEVIVYDAFGKLISKEIKQASDYFLKTKLDLTSMENGIYFVKITDGIKSSISQIVKQ